MVKISGSPGPQPTRIPKAQIPVNAQVPSAPVKKAATASRAAAARSTSSMAAPVAAHAKAPAQQKVDQQVAAFSDGPLRQALQHALQGALNASDVGAVAATLAGLTPAQQQDLSALFARAGQSTKASPRTDANAERTFLLKALADGASGPTLKRLAEQIRGRAPTNQGFSFNPLSASGVTSKKAATPSPVDAAAQKLKAAMDDIWGTDEDAVFEALSSVDPSDLPKVAEKYQKLTGTSLEEAFNLELEGADLQRALESLKNGKASAPAKPPTTAPVSTGAPVKATAPTQATAQVATPGRTSAADIQKNLDAIQVTTKDRGVVQHGNSVELNLLIPINVATWDPPKAKIYAPLKTAVEDQTKATKALADASKPLSEKDAKDPAKVAKHAKALETAQNNLKKADAAVETAGKNLQAWMKKHIDSNPELRGAKKAVEHAQDKVKELEKKHKKAKVPADATAAEKLRQDQKTELDAAKAAVTTAQDQVKTVAARLDARIENFQPKVGVKETGSSVVVDGQSVSMADGRETAYTNLWEAVDGGARGEDRETVVDQLAKSGISTDRQNILNSISKREGTFSKVNTWDTGRVSWGFTQWTLGKSGNGTLAEFMRDLKKTDPALYEKRFGKYGLDIDSKGVVLTRGDGSVLRGVAAAEAIRSDVKLAAVFMAAGADPAVQQAQIKYASDGKISGPRNHAVEVHGKNARGEDVKAKLKLKDVVTSEYGNAIMADLEVNAGQGQSVASAALAKYVKDHNLDPAKVAEWGPDAEKAVIAALEHKSRGERVTHHKKAGFSTEPNSFAD